MKITKQGFEITEIGQYITALTSDGERVRFTFVTNSVGDKAYSPMFDVPEIDATIEALQAARRMLAGEPADVNAGKKLRGLTDRDGSIWHLRDGRYFLRGSTAPYTRGYLEDGYGPVTEIWE